MNLPLVIGLCGASKVGKTTLAVNYLKHHGFHPYSILEQVKDLAKSFKSLAKEDFDDKSKNEPHRKLGGGTPTEFLNALSSLGNQFSQDKCFWLEQLYEKKLKLVPEHSVCVIHDVQTREEAKHIRSLGGYLVLIERKNCHWGFFSFDYDLVLPANKNENPQELEQFGYKVAEWVQNLKRVSQ